MRTGYTISVLGHCALLAWAALTFHSKAFDVADSVNAEIISERDFSTLVSGLKTAQQVQKPLPVVDKTGDPKDLVKDPVAKVTAKPEIQPNESMPPPPPELKPPEPMPPQPKPAAAQPPAAQPQDAKPAAPPEPDPIAEALKKEEARKKEEAKKEEAKKREEAKKEEAKRREEARKREEDAKKRDEAKFDLDRIQAALLDKRAPQRQAVTGTLVNPTPSLGSPTANAPELSQSEIDALRAQLMGCWNPPVGVAEAKDLVVIVRFALNRDGSVAGEPLVVNHGSNSLFQVAAESATRAVRRCQPFRLPVAKYDAWRDVEVKFDPNDMFRG